MSAIEGTNISLWLVVSNMRISLQLVKKNHKIWMRHQMEEYRRKGKASVSFCHCALRLVDVKSCLWGLGSLAPHWQMLCVSALGRETWMSRFTVLLMEIEFCWYNGLFLPNLCTFLWVKIYQGIDKTVLTLEKGKAKLIKQSTNKSFFFFSNQTQ